jgi:hypothetical protein
MDIGEVYGLTQVVKEANGLQLHSIATMAMNRLREIETKAKEELAGAKVAAPVVAQAKEPSKAEAPAEPAPTAADAAKHTGRRA